MQFHYRDRFKLTFEEYQNEPYEIFLFNLEAMRIENQVETEKMRKAEKRAKMESARLR